MRSVTMATLMGRIRFEADMPSLNRLPASDLANEINASWQALREMTCRAGHKAYLKLATGTLTVGQLAGAAFGSLDLPSDFVSLFGFDIVVNGRRQPLTAMEWQERDNFADPFGTYVGIPVGFHIYNIGVESTTSLGAAKVAMYPAPDAAYTYSLWYLPSWTDIASTNTTYVFNGVAGWEDWVVWDNVVKIATRENDSYQMAQLALNEREKAEKRVLRGSAELQRAGPIHRVDMAAINRRNSRRQWWRSGVS